MVPICPCSGGWHGADSGRGAGTGFVRFMADSYSGVLDRVVAAGGGAGNPVCLLVLVVPPVESHEVQRSPAQIPTHGTV